MRIAIVNFSLWTVRDTESGQGHCRLSFARRIRTWVLCSSLLIAGCRELIDPQATVDVGPSEPLVVNVLRAVRDEVPRQSEFFLATLRPNRETRLTFGRAGVVSNVFHQAGDRVDQGESLAEFDLTQIDSQESEIDDSIQTLQEAINAASTAAGEGAETAQQVEELQRQLSEFERLKREVAAQREAARVKAPYDAIVVESHVAVGQGLSETMAAFVVIDQAAPLVEARLPFEIAERLEPEAVVTVHIQDQTFPARLKNRSPILNAASTQLMTFEFDELDEEFWLFGKTIEVEFDSKINESGFWLPISALRREGSALWSVLVAEEAASEAGYRLESQFVEVVEFDADKVLVKGSLTAGELIVRDGTHRVVPGQLVRIGNTIQGPSSASDQKPPRDDSAADSDDEAGGNADGMVENNGSGEGETANQGDTAGQAEATEQSEDADAGDATTAENASSETAPEGSPSEDNTETAETPPSSDRPEEESPATDVDDDSDTTAQPESEQPQTDGQPENSTLNADDESEEAAAPAPNPATAWLGRSVDAVQKSLAGQANGNRESAV